LHSLFILGFMIASGSSRCKIWISTHRGFAGLDELKRDYEFSARRMSSKRTLAIKIQGDIVFEEVVIFAYEEDKEVIKGVSFLLQQVSVTALVGTSGAGKTDYCWPASHFFLNPDSAEITLDGL